MLMKIDTGMKIFANYCHALINCIFESIWCLQESKSFLWNRYLLLYKAERCAHVTEQIPKKNDLLYLAIFLIEKGYMRFFSSSFYFFLLCFFWVSLILKYLEGNVIVANEKKA
jgi:hypothetical protein